VLWPSKSADINPIEHLWSLLKKKLKGYAEEPKGIQELWKRVQEQWDNIDNSEVEYKAGSDCCCQIAWLCSFGWEIDDNISCPTLLCLNNQGAIFLSVNPAIDWHTKHIEIYYHYICEFYNNGEVDIFDVVTAKQLANSFTKNVPFSVLDFFCHESGL
jgi:hypothetical protein